MALSEEVIEVNLFFGEKLWSMLFRPEKEGVVCLRRSDGIAF